MKNKKKHFRLKLSRRTDTVMLFITVDRNAGKTDNKFKRNKMQHQYGTLSVYCFRGFLARCSVLSGGLSHRCFFVF